MMNLRSLAAALLLTGASSAQVTVCQDSFDYPFPGLVHDQQGGTGWDPQGAWVAFPNVDSSVVQANPPTNPGNASPWDGDDGIGNYVQQAIEWGRTYRRPDSAANPDIAQGDRFGVDGSILWFSFRSIRFLDFNANPHVGGMTLYDGTNLLFMMGSPWGTEGWGIDLTPGVPGGIRVVPFSLDIDTAHIVVRIDYQPGDERVRMWLNPGVDYPTLTPPDIDDVVEDHAFTEISFSSGGALYYWDDFTLAKGDPNFGTNYCIATNNSTGGSAMISTAGSPSVAAQSLVLQASPVPDQPGIVYFGPDQILFPFGNGFRCVGGMVIRLPVVNASGGVLTSVVDFQLPPVQNNLLPGSTWNFQAWFRDPAAGGSAFNLSNGVEIDFVP